MNKFIVITSIFPPTKAVAQLANINDWNLLVVGDNKTPHDWHCEKTIFLSIETQKKLNYKIANNLPNNHYSRKMIGYLYAMESGADLICDMDDDNFPLKNWGIIPESETFPTICGEGFINIYKFFSKIFLWPRGFPLQFINSDPKITINNKKSNVGIWQFLANGDPDVDAIYRLLFAHKEITFEDNGPYVLDKGVFSPFNSQNTIFKKKVFPLLYLPAFVEFRFTDIMRGLIAQPIIWNMGLRLGISNASAFQDRNPHNYFSDFKNEITTYLHSEEITQIATESILENETIESNLYRVYENLKKNNIIADDEIILLEDWLYDINGIK
jgi:hypothetical protein